MNPGSLTFLFEKVGFIEVERPVGWCEDQVYSKSKNTHTIGTGTWT